MPPQPSKPPLAGRLHALRNHKLKILIIAAALTVVFSGAAGYRMWRNTIDKQKSDETASFTKAKDLSSSGSCQEAAASLRSQLEKGIADRKVELEARIILGECLIQARKLDEAASELAKAADLAKNLNDNQMRNRAENLHTQAKAMQASQKVPTEGLNSSERDKDEMLQR